MDDEHDRLAFDAGIFVSVADHYLENRHYSTLLQTHGDGLTRELLDAWKDEAELLGVPRHQMEPTEEELTLLPRIAELSHAMKSTPSDKPWPNNYDHIAWEIYRRTDRGKHLPPYDKAGDDLQRIWYGMLRFTTEDVADVCKTVLEKIRQ